MGRGKNFVYIGQKEGAAATQHLKDIELELTEKLILEELAYGEHAKGFKQIFKMQPSILSTFIESIVVTEYIEDFIKSAYGIYGDEYNIKLFGTSKNLWHHYWIAKVKLRLFDDLIWSLNKTKLHLHKMVRWR